jgi:hypothetical protein
MGLTVHSSDPRRAKRCSFLQNHPEGLWGPHSLLFSGHNGSVLEIKRSCFELGHSPPFSAEVINEWSYACTPPICLHGVDRGSFNFTHWLLVINTYGSNLLLRPPLSRSCLFLCVGNSRSVARNRRRQCCIYYVGNTLSFGFREEPYFDVSLVTCWLCVLCTVHTGINL